ncbi:GDSL-motif lipase/hydrolase family protein [Salix suchowensis]|nr:GDSL-motif lipase/hydrolase family protein [Salix suchowensis]
MMKANAIKRSWFMKLFIFFLHCSNGIVESAGVPALFVFGDSLVDVGNNNYLSSIAKANYFPYGVDNFGPTGRFSNGKTFVDILGENLGVPYPPAFADPNTAGSRILGGVNYASAAAGILDESGQHYGQRYSLSQQVLNFETTLNQIRTLMSGGNLTEYLGKSVAVLVFGSNDYINNYLMPSIYSSSYYYNPPDFANLLLNHYTRQLLALYSLGLRKFLLAGIGPLDRCVDYVNQILGTYNEGLKSLVDQLNTHPGAMFLYGNTYGAVGDILNNPSTYGQITCLPWVVPCSNRNTSVFWDAFHPTEGVNAILAQRAFNGPPRDCYPINVQQMTLIY